MKNLNLTTKQQFKAQRALEKVLDLDLRHFFTEIENIEEVGIQVIKNHVSNMYGNTYTELRFFSGMLYINAKGRKAGFRSARDGSVLAYNPGGWTLSEQEKTNQKIGLFFSALNKVMESLKEGDREIVKALGYSYALGEEAETRTAALKRSASILDALLFVEHSAIDLPSNFAD
jgi:hypothetical protein